MAEKYKGQVEFLLIYIREAHPTDGWQTPKNVSEGVLLSAAKDFAEKEGHASSCVRNLGIKFTTAVDKMNAEVELNYMGWPDRLYLIGKDGRIAWKGDPGPQGFKPAMLEEAIQKDLAAR